MLNNSGEGSQPLITQEDAIIHFIQKLDSGMVDTILDESRTYQDLRKDVFIRKLGYAFDEFVESGDTLLRCSPGQCNSDECNHKCRGFSFSGDVSGRHMDLIIEKSSEGKVLDIYECRHFLCDGNEQSNDTTTRVRINIDNS